MKLQLLPKAGKGSESQQVEQLRPAGTDQGWGKAWKPPLPTLHGADEDTFSNSLWPLKGLGNRHGPSFTLEATLRTHPGMTKKVADSVQLQSLKLPESAILAL